MIRSVRTRYSDNFQYYMNDFVIGQSLRLYAEYGQQEIDFLAQVLNKNCIVYDIGANIGYHATAFAKAAGFVFAFEPNLKNYKLLYRNTEKLNNVCLVNAAVGEYNGFSCIADFDPDESGNFGNLTTDGDGQPVLTIKLDDFVNDERIPTLIKIDVEGNEYSVIMGCKKLIAKYKPVIYFEAHETKELSKIYNFLDKHGYTMTWCTVANYNPLNFAGNTENIFDNTVLMSILACPFELPNLIGDKVIGPDDNYLAYFDRCKEAYVKLLEQRENNDKSIKETIPKRKKRKTTTTQEG